MTMCLARPGWAENVPPRTTHPSGERCRDAFLQATEGQDTVGQADAWPEAPGHSATTRPEPPGVDTVGVAGALQARKGSSNTGATWCCKDYTLTFTLQCSSQECEGMAGPVDRTYPSGNLHLF